jgi:succinate dehydrogenase hydrophobic anchor subunit
MNQTGPTWLSRISMIQLLHRSRGSGYLVTWAHRISGVMLVLYVLLHINTLSSLVNPDEFARKMQLFSTPAAVFGEWLLALPVIFHSLNGGRLLVYELFTSRHDRLLLGWVYLLTATYMGVLGYLMILGNQQVSAHFFWLLTGTVALLFSYPIFRKVISGPGSLGWKLHRMSAAILFLLVPAHMLFMHLTAAAGRDAAVIAQRMSEPLIIGVDALLLCAILYHGGYGLIGILRDYSDRVMLIRFVTVVTTLVFVLFGLRGILLLAAV